MDFRKLAAEALGTAILVFVAVGVATLSFGFRIFGPGGAPTSITGSSTSSGIVATALAFGLVLLALAYTFGPISGAHVNPAVTMGFLVSGRLTVIEAVGYWIAQFAGGIIGALGLWGVFSCSPAYSRKLTGLGTDGYHRQSMVGLSMGGALLAETLLTFLFVFVVLAATSRLGSPGFAGLAIGLALAVVHLMGIPLTGTSVNPARSFGPALVEWKNFQAIDQVWVFIVAPLAGGILAALAYRFFFPARSAVPDADAAASVAADRAVGRTSGTP